jgi:hypothetical protein
MIQELKLDFLFDLPDSYVFFTSNDSLKKIAAGIHGKQLFSTFVHILSFQLVL